MSCLNKLQNWGCGHRVVKMGGSCGWGRLILRDHLRSEISSFRVCLCVFVCADLGNFYIGIMYQYYSFSYYLLAQVILMFILDQNAI